MHKHHGDHKHEREFHFSFDDDSGQPRQKRGRKKAGHNRRRNYERPSRRFDWFEELDSD
ncbi:MAG: hypothetical protein R3192_08565 [Woeseiaceae bacterium]|nr:hypothetical protein [Woeseiaceae bacterium]